LEEEGCRRREFKAQAAFSASIQGRSTGPVRASSVAVREILELDRRGGDGRPLRAAFEEF
jgi:hypothetical protein